jgi:LPXTG-motif cell wall-anchored protein
MRKCIKGVLKLKKFRRALSLVVTFLFLVTLVPRYGIKVTAEETVKFPAADMMAVLVGDFVKDQGLGEDWKPENTGTIMKEYSKGIYELTVDFKVAKSYNYKVAFNGQWDNPKALGNNGENKALNVTAPGKVTFRVDAISGKVYDSINDSKEFKSSATVVGSLDLVADGGKNWTPSDAAFDMDYIGGGFYKKTFPLKAGKFEYKAAYNHAWNNGEVGANIACTVPENGADVTFLANPILGIVTDSINNPSINTTESLVGSIRGTSNEENWAVDKKGYEFSYINGEGKYIYSGFYKAGDYEYKAAEDYSWASGGIPSSGNAKITIPDGGKYVVFVVDKKAKTIKDSINNPQDVAEALGLKAAPVEVKSPIINSNGTVTFNYKNPDAASVYLAGSMTNWQDGKKVMTKNADGVWSITLRLGDAANNYEYKFIEDNNWITDPLNTKTANGNSVLEFPAYSGRKVVLAGTIQTVVGETAWTPGSDKTTLNYNGNGMYSITIKAVPKGSYEYKVAMGSWTENYGAERKRDGANIPLVVPTIQDVTFWYSDDSHAVADSVNYKHIAPKLQGTGIPENTFLKDESLTGVYRAVVNLTKGTHNDLTIVVDNKTLPVGNIDIAEDSKTVTISYDSVTEIVFNDASNKEININALRFDSRDLEYKNPYGAVPTDKEVTFNLRSAKDDIVQAKLILLTPDGTKVVDMVKSGSFDANNDKWTTKYTFSKLGMNKYYFVVSNGSTVKAYGDDDGYFGLGMADDLGKVKQYDLNVYDKNFKTPDWIKNGVIYQIFPDRFFNGDLTNDYNQKNARGDMPYEFPQWYENPEDPALEYETNSNGSFKLDANGNKIKKSGYTGFKGDGNWSNEMYGGDLAGVNKKLDYLQSLGVNILYFNPVGQSISNHRYDTTDYKTIDPLLGKLDDFVNLSNEAKKRGMHIILDGVFNHVSDDSIYFDRYGKFVQPGKPLGGYQYWKKVYDLMKENNITKDEAEKQTVAYYTAIGITDFHYKDWFVVKNNVIDKDKDGNAVPVHYEYEGWWGYDSMPIIQAFNGSEYQVKTWADEVIDGSNSVSRYWLNNGSSGWRLDVANEVSDETWQHFRTAVKQEGDNAIIGEIWTDASKYILGDMYDSVMNYRFRNSVLYFAKGTSTDSKTLTNAVDAMNQLEAMREQYPKEAFEAMMNLVDSHDTQRAISTFDGIEKNDTTGRNIAKEPTLEAIAKMKLIPLIQMTYPGAPTIYYGDEMGMPGADDPDDRRGTYWGKGNKELVEWYAKLTNIRHAYSVLRTGDIAPITITDSNKDDVMAYIRKNSTDSAVIAVNRKTADVSSLQLDAKNIPDGTVLTNALNSSEKYTVSSGKVTANVPKQSGIILVTNYKDVNINSSALKDAYDPSYLVKDKVRVTGITIENAQASIKVGESTTLKAVVAPENATLKNVEWSSNNKAVAEVDANGVAKALTVGEAVITATTLDGAYKASYTLKVTEAEKPEEPKPDEPKPAEPTQPANPTNTTSSTIEVANNAEAIKKALSDSKVTKVVVSAKENSKVDKSIFEAIEGQNKEITFNVGDICWTFNGKDINTIMDLDLSLKEVPKDLKDKIAAKVKAATGKDQKVFTFSFNHDGPLPGNAKITLFLGKEWAGKTVSLRRYFKDKNTYESVAGQNQVKVDANGYVQFTLDHCSDYFVTEAELPKTGGIPINDFFFIGTILIAAGTLTSRRKRA